jgi:hypothetical protein
MKANDPVKTPDRPQSSAAPTHEPQAVNGLGVSTKLSLEASFRSKRRPVWANFYSQWVMPFSTNWIPLTITFQYSVAIFRASA